MKVAIIGGGIVGATVAYYLTRNSGIKASLYDSGKGQATKAAAGIISPWLTKRRNQQWYHLARSGAALLPKLAKKTRMPKSVYNPCGMIITRDTDQKLEQLYQLAITRRETAPQIGQIQKLSQEQIKQRVPVLDQTYPGILITGGARVNGHGLTEHLLKLATENGLVIHDQKVVLVSDHQLKANGKIRSFDRIVIAAGAWIRKVLLPLRIEADIRPQKGQLIGVRVPDDKKHEEMPVVAPEGEYDFLPLGHGKLIVGATHEDNQKFDLVPSHHDALKLLATAQHLVRDLTPDDIIFSRTGTRGYTSDYGPFFGPVPKHPSLLVGGGLGSSGLTTGPIIGKFLAEIIQRRFDADYDYYEKPIQKYFRSKGIVK